MCSEHLVISLVGYFCREGLAGLETLIDPLHLSNLLQVESHLGKAKTIEVRWVEECTFCEIHLYIGQLLILSDSFDPAMMIKTMCVTQSQSPVCAGRTA